LQDSVLPALDRIIAQAALEGDQKIIVFLPTAKNCAFVANLFRTLNYDGKLVEIHSRMSQPARDRASAEFRACGLRSVLFTTDVSARGVDYADVTLVIQVRSRMQCRE
jgi:ATP-dependent RNA helicase MSS116, mitochondrial